MITITLQNHAVTGRPKQQDHLLVSGPEISRYLSAGVSGTWLKQLHQVDGQLDASKRTADFYVTGQELTVFFGETDPEEIIGSVCRLLVRELSYQGSVAVYCDGKHYYVHSDGTTTGDSDPDQRNEA
jgi:hypothetical protein